MSPTTTPPTSAPSSPRPILPPRTPTGTSSVHTFSTRIPTELHNAKSDLDPTEWKPKLHHRCESEAFRYLSQFHQSTSTLSSDGQDEKPQRPLCSRSSTTSFTSMTAPSLSRTPTTAASSLSTSAEYDFNTRPLQSRHNPMYSASAGFRGIDLVMPYVAPPIAPSLPSQDQECHYEKRSSTKAAATASTGKGLGILVAREK